MVPQEQHTPDTSIDEPEGRRLGIALLDCELRYIEINDVLAAFNGIPAHEHIGRRVDEVLPSIAPVLEPLLRQVLSSRRPLVEVEIHSGALNRRGERMRCVASFYPVLSRTGATLGLDVVVRELPAAARPHAAQELRAPEARSEALERALLRSEYAEAAARGFVYEWDLATGAVSRSAGLTRLLGYHLDEVAPTREGWSRLIHPADLERASTEGRASREASDGYSAEYRVRHKDGHYLYVWDRGLVIRDANGGAPRVVGSTIDITDRRRAAAASGLLSELSSTLSDAALDEGSITQGIARLSVPAFADWCAVFLAGPDGALHVAAEACAEPALHARVSVVRSRFGRDPLLDLAGPSALHSAGEVTLKVVLPDEWPEAAGHEPHHRQLLHELGLTSLAITPLTARGELLGVLVWALAGNERRYDSSDAELVGEMARRAAQAIENARLYRQAQEAVAERDLLFTIATHDLRNALTGLLGQAQLLRRRAAADGLSERNQRSVEVIVDQAVRLNTMIGSLLDLARMREGLLAIDPSELDVCALVEQIAEALQPTLTDHSLSLALPGRPLLVAGDAVRLEQVLQNLLNNAVKYSPNGGPVAIQVCEEPGWAVVTVSDRGIGIPPDALPRLFERFYRAPNADEQAGASVGVGLYVVKEIVGLHRGSVAVESTPGEGSRFTVRLPLLDIGAATG